MAQEKKQWRWRGEIQTKISWFPVKLTPFRTRSGRYCVYYHDHNIYDAPSTKLVFLRSLPNKKLSPNHGHNNSCTVVIVGRRKTQ